MLHVVLQDVVYQPYRSWLNVWPTEVRRQYKLVEVEKLYY